MMLLLGKNTAFLMLQVFIYITKFRIKSIQQQSIKAILKTVQKISPRHLYGMFTMFTFIYLQNPNLKLQLTSKKRKTKIKKMQSFIFVHNPSPFFFVCVQSCHLKVSTRIVQELPVQELQIPEENCKVQVEVSRRS